MGKVWPYLSQGLLLCLGGLAFFYLSRKLSLVNCSDFSESFEASMAELKGWKRQVELDLETQFDRVRSIAGRIDRAKRKDSSSQDPPGEAQEGPNELDDQGKLNQMLAKRFHGV